MTMILLISITIAFGNTFTCNAATQAKVRTATSIATQTIAQFSKAALSNVKAHPYKTAAIAAGIGLAGYAKYRHGWYDQQLARLEKLQAQCRAYKNNTIKNALSSGATVCPDGIVKIISELATPTEEELKSTGDFERNKSLLAAKRQALAVRQLTFEQFLKGDPMMHMSIPEIACSMLSLLLPWSMLTFGTIMCSFNVLWYPLALYFNIPCYNFVKETNYGSLFGGYADEDGITYLYRIYNWKEAQHVIKKDAAFFLKAMLETSVIVATVTTLALARAWLRERDSLAKVAATQLGQENQKRADDADDAWMNFAMAAA